MSRQAPLNRGGCSHLPSWVMRLSASEASPVHADSSRSAQIQSLHARPPYRSFSVGSHVRFSILSASVVSSWFIDLPAASTRAASNNEKPPWSYGLLSQPASAWDYAPSLSYGSSSNRGRRCLTMSPRECSLAPWHESNLPFSSTDIGRLSVAFLRIRKGMRPKLDEC